MVLLGISEEDTPEDIQWLAPKIIQMRIFSDEQGKMNLSLKDVGGSVLLISQFTLFAQTKKGNRPSFIRAAKPGQAIPLYEGMAREFKKLLGAPVEQGVFGGDMKIDLLNDGPVTIVMDTADKDRH